MAQITAQSPAAEKTSVYDAICGLGMYLFMTMMSAAGFIGGLLVQLLAALGRLLARFGGVLAELFRKLGRVLAKPFVRYGKAFDMGRKEIKKAAEEKGFFAALRASLRMAAFSRSAPSCAQRAANMTRSRI